MLERRPFLHTTAATGAVTLAGVAGPVGARYDFVIRGGRVMELRSGEFEFVDTANTPRKRTSKLFSHASVVAGRLVRRPS